MNVSQGSVFPFGTTYSVQCGGFTQEHLATIVARAKRAEAPLISMKYPPRAVAPIIYHILYGNRELTLDYCHSLLNRVQSLHPKP